MGSPPEGVTTTSRKSKECSLRCTKAAFILQEIKGTKALMYELELK
jgi:hypothetical protein